MKRNYIAIFEHEEQPSDHFGEARSDWKEVAREYVQAEPQPIGTQRAEFVDAAQTKTTQKSIYTAVWSPSLANSLTTACRMKIRRDNVVDESDPDSDANFRIFGIEQIVNVREDNRELQLMVTERI